MKFARPGGGSLVFDLNRGVTLYWPYSDGNTRRIVRVDWSKYSEIDGVYDNHDPGDEDRSVPSGPQPGDMVRWCYPAWEPDERIIVGEVESVRDGRVHVIRDASGRRYDTTLYPAGVELLK